MLKSLLSILAFGLTALALKQTIDPPPQAAGYRLAFHDEFDTLDVSQNGAGSHTWYVNTWFNTKRPPIENVFASNSELGLVWRDTQESPDTTITTMSTHARSFRAWRYGYFEARIRWDVVRGAWPAFWLIPVEDANRKATVRGVKETGEIDIFEGQGENPLTFYGTIHDWVNGRRVQSSSQHNAFKLPPGTDLSKYHKYGVLWVPGKVSWFFDDQLLHSEETYPIFDQQNYYLVLGMQEGVDWKEGNRDGVTARAMTLNADWVQVWSPK